MGTLWYINAIIQGTLLLISQEGGVEELIMVKPGLSLCNLHQILIILYHFFCLTMFQAICYAILIKK